MPNPFQRLAASRSTASSIVCLGALAFDATDGQPLPTRMLIAKWGENVMRGTKEKFVVNDNVARNLAAGQAARGIDGVPGDYEHQASAGHPNFKPGAREYWAKNGKVEVVPGEGIYYSPGDYTPSGKQHAAGYQDLSGVFIVNKKTREVMAITSVSLCEHGQVEGAEFKQAALAIAAAMQQGETVMEQILTHLRDLLDISEDAKPEDINASLEALVRQKNTATKPTQDPAKDKPETQTQSAAMDADLKALLDAQAETNKTLTAGLTNLSASVAALMAGQQAAAHNAAVELELTAAIQAGKVVPEDLKKKDDKGQYVIGASMIKTVVDALPVTVQTEFATHAGVVSPVGKAAADQATAQVCAAMGLAKEVFDKGHGLQAGTPHGDEARKLTAAA